jgi:hypothetical protein
MNADALFLTETKLLFEGLNSSVNATFLALTTWQNSFFQQIQVTLNVIFCIFWESSNNIKFFILKRINYI